MALEDILGGNTPSETRGALDQFTSSSPARRPLYRPAERSLLSILYEALQGGLDPMTFLDTYSGVTQGAQERRTASRENQQAQRQSRLDMLSGLGSQLTEAAIGGVPPAGLEALVGLQSAANPMLAKPGVQSRLDELVSSAGTLSNSVPGAASDPAALSEELATIDATVPVNIAAEQNDPESRSGFYDTLALLRTRWDAMGLDAESIRKLRDYFAQSWTSAGGVIPAAPGQEPADAAGGGGGGAPSWLTSGLTNLVSPLTALPRYGLSKLLD